MSKGVANGGNTGFSGSPTESRPVLKKKFGLLIRKLFVLSPVTCVPAKESTLIMGHISDIAHNLKAPLNGIFGLIETVQGSDASDNSDDEKNHDQKEGNKASPPPVVTPYVAKLLSSSALRLSKLIDEILGMLRNLYVCVCVCVCV